MRFKLFKNSKLKSNAISYIALLSAALAFNIAYGEIAFAQAQETIIVTGKANKYNPKNIVTATKTDTPLLNVPQSVNVITREVLDDQASRSLSDVLHYIPGITVGQGEGNRDQITIRGQATTADFFIDGVRDDVQYYRNLYNIERVEVLKGPYALIFGRGGGGGIVNRVQKSPLSKDFIKTRASINSFGAYDIGFDYNSKINDNSAFRINAFYENLENHRDYFGGERYAVNPYYAVSLNDDWKLGVSYEYVNDKRVTDRGVPSKNMRPAIDLKKQFFGVPNINEASLEANIAKLRLDGNLSDNVSVTSSLLYGDYDKSYTNVYANRALTDLNTVELDAYKDPTKRNNFLFQSNLIWDTNFLGLSHTIMGGFEYSNQKTDNSRQIATFAPTRILNLNSIVFPNVSFGAKSRDTSSEVKVLSVYAQDQITINEKFLAIIGLRFDKFDINGRDILAARNFARIDEEVSPRLGLIYKPKQNTSLYASYSKSFLPRSGEQFLSMTITQENLAPEEFENKEIGFKWDLLDNLSLNIAAFELLRSNSTTPDPRNVLNTINIGETKTSGTELSLVGSINKKWQISSAYSIQEGVLEGNSDIKLAQVPSYQGSLWNKYQFNSNFGMGFGIIHQSSFYAQIRTNGTVTSVPEFTRADAAAYVKLNDKANIQINVENLFGVQYFSDAHNNNNITPGAPSNIRFTISSKF